MPRSCCTVLTKRNPRGVQGGGLNGGGRGEEGENVGAVDTDSASDLRGWELALFNETINCADRDTQDFGGLLTLERCGAFLIVVQVHEQILA